MSDARLQNILSMIDAANAEDPSFEVVDGQPEPRALVYGRRMMAWLDRLAPDASELLKIAARGQHIRRWEVPRDSYPATREGYLMWRSYLYGFHANQVAALMAESGYDDSVIGRVRILLQKRGIKTDPEVQLIEDLACLVFLENDLVAFAAAQDTDRLIGIIQKTWKKMSQQGHEHALSLSYPDDVKLIIGRALAPI
jgi:hypothetical protein